MPRLLASLVVLAVLVVACATAGPSDEATPTASTELDAAASGGLAQSPTSSTAPSGDVLSGASGASAGGATVQDYLGGAAVAVQGRGGAGGFDLETIEAEQRLVELEVQRCMRAQGFDYVPEETGTGLRTFAAASNQGLDPADEAATIGFGISTSFDAVFAGDIALDDTTSPNDEIVAALSEGEADAWQVALRGVPPERDAQGRLIDPETGEPIDGGPGRNAGGCRLEAQLAVRGDLSQLDELATAWQALEDRIAADPDLTAIDRAWASCMLDRGFDHDTPTDARASIRAQFQPMLVSFAASASPDGQAQRGRDRGIGALRVIAANGLTDDQAAELDALQDLEVATAIAAFECGEGTAEQAAEIRARYEAAFVEEHRAALEAFSN